MMVINIVDNVLPLNAVKATRWALNVHTNTEPVTQSQKYFLEVLVFEAALITLVEIEHLQPICCHIFPLNWPCDSQVLRIEWRAGGEGGSGGGRCGACDMFADRFWPGG